MAVECTDTRLVRPWSTCWRSSLYFPHNMNTAPRLKTHLSGATSAPGGGSAEAPDLDPGLVLLVHYCLAYPDTQLACWLLIYDGCPSRGDSQAPPPPPAQPRHTRRLIITTFQSLPTGSPSHLEDQELYFMCSTEVCSPADGDCIEGCFSGRSGSSGDAITNTGQLRSGKTLPGLTNPGSCCATLMAKSGFGVSSTSPWPHPVWCQRCRLVVYWCGECLPSTR
ncbi:uncharacterized protein LOC121568994 isoform X3 [Coregonus clupeaformis]|uniref:uncharacterized protein LOC121568994 isoform X3 n=1 Tax=Coregonus clupeaformis TaxID=59861 RepID=UPI001BE014AF|nr:uncharacterized protein LOC121568994 isoform X3 [Coregonus clupeaformis]